MSVAHAWHRFRDAPPGQRFRAHYEHVQRESRAARAAHIVIGVLLIAAGIVMLFIPGPGILAILFGLAMIGGISRRIAERMDHGETRVRGWWARRRHAPQ